MSRPEFDRDWMSTFLIEFRNWWVLMKFKGSDDLHRNPDIINASSIPYAELAEGRLDQAEIEPFFRHLKRTCEYFLVPVQFHRELIKWKGPDRPSGSDEAEKREPIDDSFLGMMPVLELALDQEIARAEHDQNEELEGLLRKTRRLCRYVQAGHGPRLYERFGGKSTDECKAEFSSIMHQYGATPAEFTWIWKRYEEEKVEVRRRYEEMMRRHRGNHGAALREIVSSVGQPIDQDEKDKKLEAVDAAAMSDGEEQTDAESN